MPDKPSGSYQPGCAAATYVPIRYVPNAALRRQYPGDVAPGEAAAAVRADAMVQAVLAWGRDGVGR